ncbi:hypothetical protein [Glycomyces sp. NPDC048151]|uniref:hypothetical protein n=1 Tax=Glycomyces sp. NPDC048151 TaxID=3364002 RepID=UPI0037117DD8
MAPIFRLSPGSPLAAAVAEDWGLLPLRVPAGWSVVYNELSARRLPDGSVEANDSEDLYWARTATPRDIGVDVGWYGGQGFRVVLLDPGWESVRASFTTVDLEALISTLEDWMLRIAVRGELP